MGLHDDGTQSVTSSLIHCFCQGWSILLQEVSCVKNRLAFLAKSLNFRYGRREIKNGLIIHLESKMNRPPMKYRFSSIFHDYLKIGSERTLLIILVVGEKLYTFNLLFGAQTVFCLLVLDCKTIGQIINVICWFVTSAKKIFVNSIYITATVT